MLKKCALTNCDKRAFYDGDPDALCLDHLRESLASSESLAGRTIEQEMRERLEGPDNERD